MIFISCDNGPNFTKDDIWIALITPFRNKKSSLKKAQQTLSQRLGRETHLFDSGRSALTNILRAFNFEKGSEVIIQAYSCIVVPNSILQAGLTPVIGDIDESLNIDAKALEGLITKKTKAIIVQHNFGNPADMATVTQLCKKYNIKLIEDCAHSLGATYMYNGTRVQCGEIGDAALFSFGRDKCASSVTGGAGNIHPKHVEASKRFKDLHTSSPTTTLSQHIKSLLYPILVTGLVIPLYHWYIGKVIMVAIRKMKLLPSIYSLPEKEGDVEHLKTPRQLGKTLGPLLHHQLSKLDSFVLHRTQITSIYQNAFEQEHKGETYMRYPLVLEQLNIQKSLDEIKREIKSKARSQGIFLGNWYTQLFVDSKGKEYIQEDRVPHAARLRGNVLNLPTNIRTSPEVAKKIVSIVTSSL